MEEEVSARHHALASVISLQKLFEVAGQNATPKRTPCKSPMSIWQSGASSARYITFPKFCFPIYLCYPLYYTVPLFFGQFFYGITENFPEANSSL